MVLAMGCCSSVFGAQRPVAPKTKKAALRTDDDAKLGVPRHELTRFERGVVIIPDSVVAQRHVTLAELLEGRIAGLQAANSTGAPGSAMEVLLRNRASIRGDLQPVYILDGVMLNPSMQDNANPWSGFDKVHYQALQNTLMSINANDIASIEVIKEASATALYGDRGADGVVIIKTRSGASKKYDVNVSMNWGVKTVARRLDMLNPGQYAEYMDRRGVVFDRTQPHDWQEDLFRPALNQNYNIGLAGTAKNTNYNISGWITSDDGVVRSTGSNSVGLLTNLDQKVSKNLRVGIRMLLDRSVVNSTLSSAYLGASSVMTAVTGSPYAGEGENVCSMLNGYDDKSTMWRLLPQVYLKYDFARYFSLDVHGGMDFMDKKRYLWLGEGTDKGEFENYRAGRSDLRGVGFNTRAALKGDFRIAGKHRLQMMVVGEYFGNTTSSLLTSASDFVDGSLGFEGMSLGANIRKPSFVKTSYDELAVGGQLAYSFDDRYVVSGGLRGDCVVDMDSEMQLYPFCSVAVNLSNHAFWEPLRKVISTFELQAGYGASGRSSVEPYSNLGRYTLGDETLWVPYQKQLYYSGIWRSVLREYNAGVTVGLLGGRINVDVRYYNGETEDKLSVRNNSPKRPYDIAWLNTLKMERHGVEVMLAGTPLKRDRMLLSLSANVAFPRNTITDAGTENLLGATGSPGFRGNPVGVLDGENAYVSAFIEGYAPGVFYGYRTQGVVTEKHLQQTPPFKGRRLAVGDVKFIDVNKDGQVDEYDMVPIGNPNPKALFGFNAKFRYKRFSASLSIDGALGGDILNLNLLSLDNVAGSSNLRSETYSRSLRGQGPALGSFGVDQISDRTVEDGSYCRLSNVTFSYSFALPKRVKWISSLDINLVLGNLVTLTGYSGYDPQVNSFAGDWTLNRVDLGSYPRSRFVSLGFGAKF